MSLLVYRNPSKTLRHPAEENRESISIQGSRMLLELRLSQSTTRSQAKRDDGVCSSRGGL